MPKIYTIYQVSYYEEDEFHSSEFLPTKKEANQALKDNDLNGEVEIVLIRGTRVGLSNFANSINLEIGT